MARKLISKDAIEAARKVLQEAPQVEPNAYPLEEAISLISEQISAAMAKGYTPQDIAGMIKVTGWPVPLRDIKSALPLTPRNAKKSKRAQGKGTAVTQQIASARPSSERIAELAAQRDSWDITVQNFFEQLRSALTDERHGLAQALLRDAVRNNRLSFVWAEQLVSQLLELGEGHSPSRQMLHEELEDLRAR